MVKIVVIGGVVLYGEVSIFGVKNVVFFIFCVILLVDELVEIINVLYLYDVVIMVKLLGELGVKVIID